MQGCYGDWTNTLTNINGDNIDGNGKYGCYNVEIIISEGSSINLDDSFQRLMIVQIEVG